MQISAAAPGAQVKRNKHTSARTGTPSLPGARACRGALYKRAGIAECPPPFVYLDGAAVRPDPGRLNQARAPLASTALPKTIQAGRLARRALGHSWGIGPVVCRSPITPVRHVPWPASCLGYS